MHLVSLGCIKPLCDLLEVKDAKVVIVALEGLENILRVGEQQKTNDINDIATMIDEADGVNKIQALQYHANEDIYMKSMKIVEAYFNGEEDAEDSLAPTRTPTHSSSSLAHPRTSPRCSSLARTD
ncbi:Importin alpha-2 subunit [Phytophthora cinnamomi]|uniref:Importin alpha-2 subunit n=1 Tax=Phytophthora cinnamomi TaxID=4785 RepID=UPI0035598938|nr:Importin alpha-2 subunit [Phytophthora cinnamomi]